MSTYLDTTIQSLFLEVFHLRNDLARERMQKEALREEIRELREENAFIYDAFLQMHKKAQHFMELSERYRYGIEGELTPRTQPRRKNED